jgi:hypothetical protein
LILNLGKVDGGTHSTVEFCLEHEKPYCVVQLDSGPVAQAVTSIRYFLSQAEPKTLNVAGPRESKCPGIQDTTLQILRLVFKDEASQPKP